MKVMATMKLFITLIATALLVQAGDAQASDTQSNSDNNNTAPVPGAALNSGSGTGVGISIPQISAKSEVAGESVTLTIGKASEVFSKAAIRSFTVSATAPYNKDRNEGFLLTDAGLPTTLSAAASYSWSFLPGFDSAISGFGQPTSSDIENEVTVRCYKKYGLSPTPAADRNRARNKCETSLFEVIQDLAKEDYVGDKIGDITLNIEGANQQNSDDKIAVEKYNKYDKERRAVMTSLSYHALSLTGSVGGDNYKFRDPATLGELKRKQTLFSFGGAYSYIPNISKPWGYFFGGEYRRTYKLPDAEIRCPPMAAGANSTTCVTSAFAPPKRNTDATAFAAIRYDASVGEKDTPLAFELKLAYDAEDDEWGASLPVYFVQDDKGKLNGGVKFGWDGEKNDFSIGFFIGTNFDFLKL
jgi:hypothetical protein